jgi:hypothetical protein
VQLSLVRSRGPRGGSWTKAIDAAIDAIPASIAQRSGIGLARGPASGTDAGNAKAELTLARLPLIRRARGKAQSQQITTANDTKPASQRAVESRKYMGARAGDHAHTIGTH